MVRVVLCMMLSCWLFYGEILFASDSASPNVAVPITTGPSESPAILLRADRVGPWTQWRQEIRSLFIEMRESLTWSRPLSPRGVRLRSITIGFISVFSFPFIAGPLGGYLISQYYNQRSFEYTPYINREGIPSEYWLEICNDSCTAAEIIGIVSLVTGGFSSIFAAVWFGLFLVEGRHNPRILPPISPSVDHLPPPDPQLAAPASGMNVHRITAPGTEIVCGICMEGLTVEEGDVTVRRIGILCGDGGSDHPCSGKQPLCEACTNKLTHAEKSKCPFCNQIVNAGGKPFRDVVLVDFPIPK